MYKFTAQNSINYSEIVFRMAMLEFPNLKDHLLALEIGFCQWEFVPAHYSNVHKSIPRVNFNVTIMEERDDAFKNNIVHEFAHIITQKLYPEVNHFKNPHSQQFKKVCEKLALAMDLDPTEAIKDYKVDDFKDRDWKFSQDIDRSHVIF